MNSQKKQRLVICLDGTWNKQDTGTNVYHLSNLIKRGPCIDADGVAWIQRIYYHEGVGTGLLDRVRGGMFGSGLSEAVRLAYNWLVRHYNDDDEIYLFGFSRGAFTARSLVGLIRRCGLLHRGAPISTEELWAGYKVIGRFPLPTHGIPFRELWCLKTDPWDQIDDPEWHRVPPATPANRTEKLLKEWSRRVPIKCVGVFDTVGALGWDALAIPRIRTHKNAFHDPRLTILMENGFHALAIDEHRANFLHTPWYREFPCNIPPNAPANRGRIEQRWFIGAHSNIGGGYDDDVLSQYPLIWMIEECQKQKLVFRESIKRPPYPDFLPLLKGDSAVPRLGLPKKAPLLRDSFGEFGKGCWKYIIRAKPEYRRIKPPMETRMGQTMQSLNETIDESVFELANLNNLTEGVPRYNPPNLCASVKYDPQQSPAHKELFAKKPKLVWIDGVVSVIAWLLWMLAVVYAAGKVGGWLNHEGWNWWWAVSAFFIISVADTGENILGHWLALTPDAPKAKLWESCLSACVVFRISGILGFLTAIVILLSAVVT